MAKEGKGPKPKVLQGEPESLLRDIKETPYDDVLFSTVRGKWAFANSSQGSGTALRFPSVPQPEALAQAEKIRRAHEWVRENQLGKNWAANDKGLFIETLPKLAAPRVVFGLMASYQHRTEGKGFTEERVTHLQEHLPAAYEDMFRRYLIEGCDLSEELTKFYEWLGFIFTLDAIEHADDISASDDEWKPAFQKRFNENRKDKELLQETFISYSQSFAHQYFVEVDPLKIPLEELLELLGGADVNVEEANLPKVTLPTTLGLDRYRVMSMSAAQIIDRAARGPGNWIRPSGKLPRYEDARSGHVVEYLPSETDLSSLNDETLEKIHQQVMDLNPRAADVWRLVTARSLEAWQEDQLEPPAVWLDVREVARAMGYTEHVNGGMKPEHLFEVAKSIKDLESFHITIPIGEKVLDVPDKKGKRKSQRLQAARHSKVLIKVAWDDVRDMFGHSYPLRWKLKPGEWIQLYPRQFAPLFKALVEMPAKAGKYMWAKSIGTELAYYYRQDRTRAVEKVLKVSTILERACLINEAKQNRKKGRVREYFEDAMDLLRDSDVCHGWEYYREDINAVETSYRGWFDTWLEVRVRITAPEDIVRALPKANAK